MLILRSNHNIKVGEFVREMRLKRRKISLCIRGSDSTELHYIVGSKSRLFQRRDSLKTIDSPALFAKYKNLRKKMKKRKLSHTIPIMVA